MRSISTSQRLLLPALLAASAAVAATLVATGEQGGAPAARGGTLSVGNSNDGRLVRGRRLPDRGVGFFSSPYGPNPDAKYGTDELIELIERLGSEIDRRAPGATLYVNDIGFEGGGPISHHESHQAGRDVDFLFFVNTPAGGVTRPVGAHFDASGSGSARGTPLRFDTARNWLLVRVLAESQESGAQRVFVSEGLRALMLDHARRSGEPAWIVERAAELMCEPAVPHDDHFHLRIFCSAEDYAGGCRDTWPLYPWRRTELAALGIADPAIREPPPEAPAKSARRRRPRRSSPGRTWCP